MSRSKRRYYWIYEQYFRSIHTTAKLKAEVKALDDLRDNGFEPSNRHKQMCCIAGEKHLSSWDDIHLSWRPKKYTANVNRAKETINFIYSRQDLFDFEYQGIHVQSHLINLFKLFKLYKINYQVDYEEKYGEDINNFLGLRFLLSSKYVFGYLDLDLDLDLNKALTKAKFITSQGQPKVLYLNRKNYFNKYSDCMFQLPLPWSKQDLDTLFNKYLPYINSKKETPEFNNYLNNQKHYYDYNDRL